MLWGAVGFVRAPARSWPDLQHWRHRRASWFSVLTSCVTDPVVVRSGALSSVRPPRSKSPLLSDGLDEKPLSLPRDGVRRNDLNNGAKLEAPNHQLRRWRPLSVLECFSTDGSDRVDSRSKGRLAATVWRGLAAWAIFMEDSGRSPVVKVARCPTLDADEDRKCTSLLSVRSRDSRRMSWTWTAVRSPSTSEFRATSSGLSKSDGRRALISAIDLASIDT